MTADHRQVRKNISSLARKAIVFTVTDVPADRAIAGSSTLPLEPVTTTRTTTNQEDVPILLSSIGL